MPASPKSAAAASTGTPVQAAAAPLGHPSVTASKSKEKARSSSDAVPEGEPRRQRPKVAEVKKSRKDKKSKKDKKDKKDRKKSKEGEESSGVGESIGAGVHPAPSHLDDYSLAQSYVDVKFSDEDSDPPSTLGSTLVEPTATAPVTPKPPTGAYAAVKDEPGAIPSPLDNQGVYCTQSLTYAIAITAMGLNDGSRDGDSLYQVYLSAKAVSRKKGRSPVPRAKFIGHLGRGTPQAKVRVKETLGRMTAAKHKEGSRFAVNNGAVVLDEVKAAVGAARADNIVECSVWRRGIVLDDLTGATDFPLGEAVIDVTHAIHGGPLRSDCLRPYAVPIVATVFSLLSPLLAEHLGMTEVGKAVGSCVDGLYKRFVAGLDRKEASEQVVQVADELEASFVALLEEEVRKKIGLHPAAGQGI